MSARYALMDAHSDADRVQTTLVRCRVWCRRSCSRCALSVAGGGVIGSRTGRCPTDPATATPMPSGRRQIVHKYPVSDPALVLRSSDGHLHECATRTRNEHDAPPARTNAPTPRTPHTWGPHLPIHSARSETALPDRSVHTADDPGLQQHHGDQGGCASLWFTTTTAGPRELRAQLMTWIWIRILQVQEHHSCRGHCSLCEREVGLDKIASRLVD